MFHSCAVRNVGPSVGLILDTAFRLPVFFRLTFCASFNTIFTAHYAVLAELLRSFYQCLLSLFQLYHLGPVRLSQCWSSNSHRFATPLMPALATVRARATFR